MSRSRLRLSLIAAALVGGASLLAAMVPQTPVERIDTTGMTPTFVEDFGGTTLATARWTQGANSDILTDRTLTGNAERQAYLSPGWLGLAAQPVTLAGGTVTITARSLTSAERSAIAAAARTLPPRNQSPVLADLAYASGRIMTRGLITQRYGYFEMRARFSPGRGLWPAFWLLPDNGSWPPEIDIMEALGHDPNTVYSTVHSAAMPRQGVTAKLTPTADGYHRYGVLWGPQTIDHYVDGMKTGSMKTPADAHRPMYIVANLAVGGHWPGFPDASTRFPATMEIDYIRAWAWREKRP